VARGSPQPKPWRAPRGARRGAPSRVPSLSVAAAAAHRAAARRRHGARRCASTQSMRGQIVPQPSFQERRTCCQVSPASAGRRARRPARPSSNARPPQQSQSQAEHALPHPGPRAAPATPDPGGGARAGGPILPQRQLQPAAAPCAPGAARRAQLRASTDASPARARARSPRRRGRPPAFLCGRCGGAGAFHVHPSGFESRGAAAAPAARASTAAQRARTAPLYARTRGRGEESEELRSRRPVRGSERAEGGETAPRPPPRFPGQAWRPAPTPPPPQTPLISRRCASRARRPRPKCIPRAAGGPPSAGPQKSRTGPRGPPTLVHPRRLKF
jgi:hypothetical protein